MERPHQGRAPLPALGVLDPLLAQPWDYVQQDTEERLHGYLHREAGEVRLVVIEGAWHGGETARMLERYESCSFVCIEPDADSAVLEARYGGDDSVVCLPLAAADATGTATSCLVERERTRSLLIPRRRIPIWSRSVRSTWRCRFWTTSTSSAAVTSIACGSTCRGPRFR